MSKIQYFSGRVLNVIFEDTSTFFYILRVRLDTEDEDKSGKGTVITVKGNILGMTVEVGSWFGFEGTWINHPAHGRQVDVTRAPMIQGGWDTKTIVKVLAAHNVGRFTLTLLEERFGDGLAQALDKPEELMQIKGVDKVTAEHIASRWKTVRALFQTLSFLSQFAIPKFAINQIWAKFGDEAEEILTSNPWELVRITGVDFKVVDEVALRLGLDMTSPHRTRGAVLYLTRSQRGMGHLFMRSGDLLARTKEMVNGLTVQQFAEALKTLRDEKLLVIDGKTKKGVKAIYEPWFHRVETESARLLLERQKTAHMDDPKEQEAYISMLGNVSPATKAYADEHPTDLEGTAKVALEEWAKAARVSLSKQQFLGALNALIHPVSIITGLPGTGKTTTLRTVVKVLQDAEVPILLTAPTGIAAKRVMSVAGTEAFTIHRALLASGVDSDDSRDATYAGIVGGKKKDATATDGSEEDWGFNEEAPHATQFLIVDESSMVDQHLLYRIMSCTSKTCRVVFVGDAAQLPSVGPGNVLRDMIESQQFPVSNLTEIFRQEDTSDIVLAAHAINSGKVPEPSPDKNDFIFLEMSSDEAIATKMLKTVSRLYDTHKNFQVLSPRHAGTLGVTNLNSRIRDLLNPKQAGLQEMRIGSETLREGDRVMVIRNNYDYDIFNGDVGKVITLDRSKKEVEIKIWGPPDVAVRLPFKDAASQLRLAYVTTVHKCLAPGTLVETPKGLMPIEDLPEQGEVATAEGFKPYRNKVENSVGPMLEIRTQHGYSITVTPDHGLQVHTKEGWVRKPASEIGPYDVLRLQAGGLTTQGSKPWNPEDAWLWGFYGSFSARILQASQKVQLEYLRGFFRTLEIDSSFEGPTGTLIQRPVKHLRDVQRLLLLRFGIFSDLDDDALHFDRRSYPKLKLVLAGHSDKLELRETRSVVVDSVSATQSTSYCIEVPDGHQFLQNGFHGWNCQGQEYDYILLPWVKGYRHQLQRNLVYTAITRARKKVFIFGQKEALKTSVQSNESSKRNTLFPERLKAGTISPIQE